MMAESSEMMTSAVGAMKQAWVLAGTVRMVMPLAVVTVQPLAVVTA